MTLGIYFNRRKGGNAGGIGSVCDALIPFKSVPVFKR
jgi:hypothetical protein